MRDPKTSLEFRKQIFAVLTGVALFASSMYAQGNNPSFCWQQSYTRTATGISTQCPSGSPVSQGGLCYPNCPTNYTGVGPVCWENCPSGFSPVGIFCQKPTSNLSSGGYETGWECAQHPYPNGPQTCHQYSGCTTKGCLWYQDCPSGYVHSNGVLTQCLPACPSDMTDTGPDCTRNTTTIGAGTVPGCGSGMDSDAGLCYPQCQSGFNGIGPVCWGSCPADKPYQCGAACATSQQACAQAIGNMALNTSAVAINILAFAFGGEAATSAIKEAAEAGESAAFDQILSHTSTNWVSMTAGVGKEYALAYGKQFVKTTLKNKANSFLDERNMFWKFAKDANNGALKGLNASTTQYGTAQTAPTDSLQMNTLISTAEQVDPTGIANLITTFTQYGNCSGNEDFAASPNELNFGSTAGNARTLPFKLVAQQPFTILRLASPTLTNMTITPTATCVGKLVNPGESCTIYVTVNGAANLDSELRIYTDNYPTVPETVHLLANPGSATQAQLFVPDQDALTMAALVGAWNMNGSVMTVNTDGSTSTGGTVTILNPNTRMIEYSQGYYTSTFYVDDEAENLINFAPSALNGNSYALTAAGPNVGGLNLAVTNDSSTQGQQLTLQNPDGHSDQLFTFEMQMDGSFAIKTDNGQVLNVFESSSADGAQIIQWPDQATSNEHFLVEPTTDGQIKLVSMSSGEVISSTPVLTRIQVIPGIYKHSFAGSPVVQEPWTGDLIQEFGLSGAHAPFVATKLPWGAGCQAGQTLYDGMCYAVDIGYKMSSPGIEGKPCPVDWRDDGTSCWPPWTGVAVAGQADPNPDPTSLTAYTMRHPIVVTSCSSYAAANNQSCPANFQNIGGPGSCSCQAITTSKNIKGVNGNTPSH